MARTRFQRADQADSDCTPASDGNKPLLSAQTGGNETLTATINAGDMNKLFFSFTMAVGDPGSENLGSGSLFRCQLDVTAAGAVMTYDIRFRALQSDCVVLGSVDSVTQESGTGLKLFTATWDPPAGTDRYQMLVRVTHEGMHSDPSETFTIRTNNANAFYEIPDTPVAGLSIPVAMHEYRQRHQSAV